VLQEYAQQTGIKVDSVDFFPPEARWYGDSIEGKDVVTCHTGNAFHMLPGIMRHMETPAALLVDGPKLYDAINLVAATTIKFSPALVALHNIPARHACCGEFRRLFPDAFHLEQLPLQDDPEWQSFRDWELEVVSRGGDGEHGPRDLADTSLVMAMHPPRPGVGQLLRCHGPWKRHPLFLLVEWLIS